MNRRRLLPSVALATATLVVLLALRPLPPSRAFAIWIVLLAAGALYSLVRVRPDGEPRPTDRFDAALRRSTRGVIEPAQLVRLERELVLGVSSAGYAHRRLLPRLRAVASARLVSRYGIELDRKPDAARAALGDDVWELVRPDRPEPEDRHGPGVPLSHLVAAIERLEAL